VRLFQFPLSSPFLKFIQHLLSHCKLYVSITGLRSLRCVILTETSESFGPVDWASDSYPLSTESLVRVLSGSAEKMRWCVILYQPREWLMNRHILLEYWSIIKQKPIVHCIWCGPGSSVGIATGYGLDGPGIKSRWGRDFSHTSRPALEPTQPPIQWVPGLSRG
jgi:hypothetical protein